MRRVVVGGGSGFIGSSVCRTLNEQGFEVIQLSHGQTAERMRAEREKSTPTPLPDWAKKVVENHHIYLRTWGELEEYLEGAYAVINLAGAKINQRWTPKAWSEIVSSRLDTTRKIAEALPKLKSPPEIWVNGSAVGYYGDRGSDLLDETSAPGTDKLAQFCVEWEAAANQKVTPVAKVRTGHVLGLGADGKPAGLLGSLGLLTKWGLGGAAGHGRQYLPWVHMEDYVALVLWLLERKESGVFNGVAPAPATSAEFMAALRKQLHRPWSPPVPAPVLSLLAKVTKFPFDLVLGGQRAMPKAAMDKGFEFKFPTLEAALADVYA